MMTQPAATSQQQRGGPYLTVTVNHAEIQRRPLSDQHPLTIGRSLDCDLWIEDPILSRRHCRVEPALEGDGFAVVDLQSRNGTFVNAERVQERQALVDGDVITIGRAHLKFRAKGYCPPRPRGPEEALKMHANRAAMHRAPAGTSQRPLPTPKVAGSSSDSGGSIAGVSNADTRSPGDSAAGARPLPFQRPPARPIVKPDDGPAA